MDGENNGKPYFLMDDLVGNHATIFGNIQISWTSLGESGFVSGRARRSFNQTALEVQNF